jgi:hypothetical protein
MMAIVLLLVLVSTAFADEYTPVDWIQVTEDGGIEVKVGIFNLSTGNAGCIEIQNITINNVTYSVATSKWQMRGEDSEWIDVPGTEHTGAICGIGTIPEMPGEYRPVSEVEVDGVIEKYTSGNTLVVAGDAETAVEAITWGSLKLRATR